MNEDIIRLDVIAYWISFFAAFVSVPFLLNGDWMGSNALCGMLIGLIVLSQLLIENAVVSSHPIPKIVEFQWPSAGLFSLNLAIGALAGCLTNLGLVLVWNLFGPESKSFSIEFGWREYVQWIIVAVPTLIVTLVVPLTGACLVARRPEPQDDVE